VAPGFVLPFLVAVKITEGLSFISHLAILILVLRYTIIPLKLQIRQNIILKCRYHLTENTLNLYQKGQSVKE
jgi:hypothetical protein